MLLLLGFLIILMVIPSSPIIKAADHDNDGIDDTKEWNLIYQYAPNLHFKAGENFYPVDCTYFINNSKLYQWVGNTSRSLVDPNPTRYNLNGYSDQHFLDCTFGNYTEILGNYSNDLSTLGYKIYGRVVNESGFYCIQYWFFYVYNDHSFNQHEGDWEMITIILNGTTEEPLMAAYSQHHIAEVAAWADIEKTDGTHPNVYVARGSHANYFRPYQGKVGFENDEVGNDGFVLPYNHPQLKFELLGEKGVGNHNASQNWLDFQGRWGDWVNYFDFFIGFAGPRTPGWGENQEKWDTPLTWAESQFAVNSTWFTLCWIMYYLLWIFIGIFAIMFALKLYHAIRNRTSDEVPKLSIVLGGRAALGVTIGVAALLITIGAIFLPWYSVWLDIQTPVISSQGTILLIDGLNGVQVNFIIAGTGTTPLFNVAIPFYIIIGTGIILSFLDIIGAKSAKKLGTKYITSGIFFLIIFIILLVFMTQMNTLLGMVSPMFGGALPSEITAIMNEIASNPFQGTYATTISGTINVDLAWGFAIGGFILIGAAIGNFLPE